MQTYTYHITIEGRLEHSWADWFGEVELHTSEDMTHLTARLPDQAALFGMLKKIHQLGLVLLEVTRLPAQPIGERNNDEQ